MGQYRIIQLMNPSKYIWLNNTFIDWGKANTHVLTHALHYGSGVFEGIRAYSTKKGPAIFKRAFVLGFSNEFCL